MRSSARSGETNEVAPEDRAQKHEREREVFQLTFRVSVKLEGYWIRSASFFHINLLRPYRVAARFEAE